MIFDRAWVLPFTLVPLLWMFWELRQTRRRTAVILKGLAFIAIALALAEPSPYWWTLPPASGKTICCANRN
jgi:hypothetical protein